MTVELGGFVYDNAGTAKSGANISIFDRNTVTPAITTTTTDSNGFWSVSGVAEGRYDVQIVDGSSTSRIKYDDEVQLLGLEVANFTIRNPADTFAYDLVPAAITAARTLNLPLITGTDTLASLGLAQTFTAAQTFNNIATSTVQGDMTFNDSVKVTLGSSGAADLYFDGTNVIIDPAVAGSGKVVIKDNGIAAFLVGSGDNPFTISANVATDDANERDIDFQILDATGDAFKTLLYLKANAALPEALIFPGFNVSVGTASIVARGTTQPTNAINIFNGTAPSGTLANGVTIYSKDDTGKAELHVMDEDGNETKLSPHDALTGEWEFKSRNSVTGKGIHVRMEEMMKRLNDMHGWDLVTEYPESE